MKHLIIICLMATICMGGIRGRYDGTVYLSADGTIPLAGDWDLGGYDLANGGTGTFGNLATDHIDFDLTPTFTPQEGRLGWNDTDGTLNIGMPGGNVNLQIGQELLLRVKNETGLTITNGSAVYVSGTTGANPTIGLATATNHIIAMATLAVATEDIANNSFGYVTSYGLVRDMDTSFVSADGQPAFLSTTAGDLSASLPTQPDSQVFVGVVIKKDATEGILFVKIIPQPNLNELSDILISSVASGDNLRWNGTVWENAGSSGSGTLGYWNRTGTVITPANAADSVTILNGQEMKFNITGNANHVGLKAGATADDTTYTLPIAVGSTDDILKTSNTGVMAWTTPTVDIPVSLSMYDAEPARGSETNWNGGLLSLATAQPLNSVPANIVVSKGSGKVMIVVNAGSDFAGDITITGTSIDRDTGATTAADTDTITVDALTTDGSDTGGKDNHTRHSFTGAYISSKWFTGSVTLSTANLTLTDVDVYHVSFEQFNDQSNITINTFDGNIFTTNIAAEFDAYLYCLEVTGSKCSITRCASLNVGTDGETALANKYWRLRRGSIARAMDGTTDGIWVDIHYSNSPSYVEDVTLKIWATKSQTLTLP